MKTNNYLIVFILTALMIFSNCHSIKSIPDELIGKWMTKAQEYQGSFFELRPNSILFGKKDGTVDSFNIINIKRKRLKGDWVSFRVSYRDDNMKKYELPFLYHPHKKGFIRFMNKEQNTWTKETS